MVSTDKYTFINGEHVKIDSDNIEFVFTKEECISAIGSFRRNLIDLTEKSLKENLLYNSLIDFEQLFRDSKYYKKKFDKSDGASKHTIILQELGSEISNIFNEKYKEIRDKMDLETKNKFLIEKALINRIKNMFKEKLKINI